MACVLTIAYAASAVGLLLVRVPQRPLGRLLVVGALALSALAQLLLAGTDTLAWPPPVLVPFVEFLLQTIAAVGMILVLLGVGQDTLLRLAESEDRFRILFEHGGVGLALLSADGVIVQANPALEQMLGYGAGLLCGLRLSDLCHPEDRNDDTRRIAGSRPSRPATNLNVRSGICARTAASSGRAWCGRWCATPPATCATTPAS